MNPLSSPASTHFGSTYVVNNVSPSILATIASRATKTFPEGEVVLDQSKGPDTPVLTISVPDRYDTVVKLGLQQAGLGDKFTKHRNIPN